GWGFLCGWRLPARGGGAFSVWVKCYLFAPFPEPRVGTLGPAVQRPWPKPRPPLRSDMGRTPCHPTTAGVQVMKPLVVVRSHPCLPSLLFAILLAPRGLRALV